MKTVIELKTLDELSAVLGTYDENLTYLSRELDLLTYVEGLKIRLEGTEEDVRVGEAVIKALWRTVSSLQERGVRRNLAVSRAVLLRSRRAESKSNARRSVRKRTWTQSRKIRSYSV